MWINLFLAAGSVAGAVLLWNQPGILGALALGFVTLAGWQFWSALTHRSRPSSPTILRVGGFSWTMEDFCRGWLITGETGSGKTLGGINTMLWQVSQNGPNWGGVCVDDKGLYAETLAVMLDRVGRKDDLLVLQVWPESSPKDWKPVHPFNFLADPYLPWSGKAKIICDVASAQGQRADQSFFRTQAQVQMEFAFRVLAAAGLPVTLETTYDLLTSDEQLKKIMNTVRALDTPFPTNSSPTTKAASSRSPRNNSGASKPPSPTI